MSKPAIAQLWKDLRIMRLLWAPMAFSYGVFLLTFMENIWIYLATGACLTFVAAATALGIDDRYQTEPLLAALPGTRRDLVAGRYLSWGSVTGAGLVLFMACTALLQAGLGWRSPRLGTLLSVKGAAALLAGALLAGLLFLPFYFRLGFWRGLWGFIGAGFALSVIALNAAAGLVPSQAWAQSSASSIPRPFVSMARGLRALAWLIDGFLDQPAVLAAAAVIFSILIYLSFRLSVSFYRKRDL